MSGLALIDAGAGPGVRGVFTTRAGGASEGPFAGLNLGGKTADLPERVRANRRVVCEALGLEADRVTMGHQVHGAQVRAVAAPTRPGRFTGGLRGWPEGDGLVTEAPGLALVVLGADCLPVLLWRVDRPAVAAVHAGWRGLVGGVLEAAIARLGDPARTAAAIGPGVGPCCYPVDAALRRRFAAAFGDETVRPPAVDLSRAARAALLGSGLRDGAVSAVDACTSCEPERFFSYRRDGPVTGRHGGIIWIG